MKRTKIGICAPSKPFSSDLPVQISALAAQSHSDVELVFSDQCFADDGHFAGDDALRCQTFVSMANDPQLDAIWFARGGYGAARIAEDIIRQMEPAARDKHYLGYSDGGNLLGALYRNGIGTQAHGPMPIDIVRDGGETAILRALDWLVNRDPSTLEPTIVAGQKYAAFNLTTLAMMVGTPLMPSLNEHILMVEEIAEYLYAFDRAMFNVTSHLADKNLTGLCLGRVSDIPENDRPFGEDAEEIARRWCARHGIAYLGRVDIGHDANNKIVPFGII